MTVPTTDEPPRPTSRWKRAAIVVGVTFALLIGVMGVGAFALYQHLNGNITVYNGADDELHSAAPTTSASGTTPASPYAAENILVMGSDTRVGQGGEGGSAAVYSTAQSDVVMVVHLSADRKRALVMSIPRDTWITLPECKTKDGSVKGGYEAKFNEAFTIGGPACTIKAVKQITKLDIDHFIVVDFNGVKNIINAMGGVNFCLTKALHDPIANGEGSGLDLPAGQQVVNGEQGLAFLRARHNIGDPSGDIGRMKRQHAFLGAMIKQVEGTSLLTNPKQLYDMLDAATKSITTDSGLGSLLKLKDLAQSLTGLKPANVTFLTIPWRDRGDGENVLISYGAANPILTAIKLDQPYPPVASTATPSASSGADALKTPPSQIHVKVVNATGTPGAAKAAGDALAKLGFVIDSVSTAAHTSTTTTVTYNPSYDESGRTLTAAVKGAASAPNTKLSTTLVVTVGTNWQGVQAVSVTTDTTTSNGGVPVNAALQTAGSVGCV